MTRRAIPRDLTGASATAALAAGEVVYDALAQTLRVGDGPTPGGIDLGRTKRSSLLTAAQYRKFSDKANDRFDLRDVAGTDVTGNNSSRAALQKAFDQAFADGVALHLPTGKIVADSTITVTNGLTVLGDSTGLGRAVAGYTEGAATGPAARIHFAHSGEGIRFEGGAGIYDGVLLRDLMFTRDQPVIPSSGTWEPADHDYNLVMNGMAGLHLQNVLDLNPTRGIKLLDGGGIGRLMCDNYMSQPLVTGIDVELAADVVRMTNTHFWPFWRDHAKVHAWALENCDHVWLKRCDTPMFTAFFSIGSRSAFRIGRNASGTVTKMKVSNYDIDYSKYCIWYDDTAQNAWARFTNGTLQANNSDGSLSNVPASINRQNLKMDGTSCIAMFNGLEISGASGTAMHLGDDANNNQAEVAGDFWVQNYGETLGNTDACIHVGAGSTFVRNGLVKNTSTGAGELLSGAGRVVGLRKAYIPGVTASAGAYVSTPLIDSEYIEDGYKVEGQVNISIVNVGTGTGPLTISTPTEVDISWVAEAINLTTNEALIAVVTAGNPGAITVRKAGGGNVAANGQTIGIKFSYVRKAA